MQRRQRRTTQSGYVERKFVGKRWLWIGRYDLWPIDPETGESTRLRQRFTDPLGECETMTRQQAQKKCTRLVHEFFATTQPGGRDGRTTFQWFTEHEYLPLKKGGAWGMRMEKGSVAELGRYIYPRIGKLPLDQITSELLLENLLKPMKEEFAVPVVNRQRALVSSILEYAKERKYIVANPSKSNLLKGITKKREAREQPYLELHEVGRLWRAIDDPRDRLIIRIASLGCNGSETLGLQRRDIHLFERYFQISSSAQFGEHIPGAVKRNDRRRKIAMTEELRREFAHHLETIDRNPNALLFPQRGKGRADRPMWPGVFLQKRIYPIARRLEITVSTDFQVLRRTFISWNRRSKEAIDADLQVVVGHRRGSKVTADIYDQIIPRKEREIVEKYEQMCYAHAAAFEREMKKLLRKKPSVPVANVAGEAEESLRRIQ